MNVSKVNNCSGCGACHHICPKKAINMTLNEEGFLQPVIDKSLCVDCGLCLKRCPQENKLELKQCQKVYAAKINNFETLKTSSSGGAFTVICEHIFSLGGTVFCTEMVKKCGEWEVGFTEIESADELKRVRGSKYVQSNTGNVFSLIKKRLFSGKIVLFVGTPCQVAGLYAFLGHDYDNLFTVDLLCHGVPPVTILNSYSVYFENKYHSELKDIKFRDKSKFGNKLTFKYIFSNKEKIILGKCDPYFSAFIKGMNYRESCYHCLYAKEQRIGDLSIGDFWGIRKIKPDFDDSNGVSLIMVNNKKGEKLIVLEQLTYVEISIESAKKDNGILNAPSKKPCERECFFQYLNKYGWKKTSSKLIKPNPIIFNAFLNVQPKFLLKLLLKIKK